MNIYLSIYFIKRTQKKTEQMHRHFVCIIVLILTTKHVNTFDSLVSLIPTRLEGNTRGESVHIADIKIGTPRRTLRVGLDFSGNKMYTMTQYSEEISSTYTNYGGGSDLIWVAGKRLRFPLEYNPIRVETLCNKCEALISVGPSSPLWVIWKEATFSSGVVSLGSISDIIKEASEFNRLEKPRQLKNNIVCEIGFENGLCKTTALVGPNKILTNVIFSFEERRTLIPDPVWDVYTNGKNIDLTPVGDWGDLKIEFINLTSDSKDTSITTRIRTEDIISPSETGSLELNLAPSGDNSTMYLGRTTFRSFVIHIDWISNTMHVIDWKVEKSYQGYIGFIIVFLGLSLVWWNGTNIGIFNVQWKLYPIKIVSMFVFICLSIATIWNKATRNSIREFLVVDIFFQAHIYLFSLLIAGCTLIHLFMRYGYGSKTKWLYNIFGLTNMERMYVFNKKQQQINALLEKINEGQKYKIIDNGHKSIIKIIHKNKYTGKIEQTKHVLHNVDVGSQRIWGILTFCVDVILFSTLIYAWSTTREDTLTGIGSLFLFSFMTIISFYHLICQFYHRSGKHVAMWYIFIGNMILYIMLLFVISEVYIYYPFIHRFMSDYSSTPFVISVLYLLSLLYFAEHVAKTKIVIAPEQFKNKIA